VNSAETIQKKAAKIKHGLALNAMKKAKFMVYQVTDQI
jgi:hypothetical protein